MNKGGAVVQAMEVPDVEPVAIASLVIRYKHSDVSGEEMFEASTLTKIAALAAGWIREFVRKKKIPLQALSIEVLRFYPDITRTACSGALPVISIPSGKISTEGMIDHEGECELRGASALFRFLVNEFLQP